MSETTDQMTLNALYQINNSVLGRNKTMTDNNNQMMLKMLVQINENLADIKRLLEGPKGDGLIVRTQESHS